ncbi:hypothetical protein TNIN_365452 [Trichonephila inaurata madagascariensis]|uniref:Uncharacterized protein n=1 Tax=Trichonephila inaurata madagascariensis TaxID=2747483 RepID=A0A8X6WTC5_9ARAC|nr:hypothetical protein TNIN_365452 [Trichonephila inaurata madagascariensis]
MPSLARKALLNSAGINHTAESLLLQLIADTRGDNSDSSDSPPIPYIFSRRFSDTFDFLRSSTQIQQPILFIFSVSEILKDLICISNSSTRDLQIQGYQGHLE